MRGWSAWGEFHEGIFLQQQLQQSSSSAAAAAASSTSDSQQRPGVSAMQCYLQALRTGVSASAPSVAAGGGQSVPPLSECKQRKLVSRVLWLLAHEEDRVAIGECFRENCSNVPYHVWLPWYVPLPQPCYVSMFCILLVLLRFNQALQKEFSIDNFDFFSTFCFILIFSITIHIRVPIKQ